MILGNKLGLLVSIIVVLGSIYGLWKTHPKAVQWRKRKHKRALRMKRKIFHKGVKNLEVAKYVVPFDGQNVSQLHNAQLQQQQSYTSQFQNSLKCDYAHLQRQAINLQQQQAVEPYSKGLYGISMEGLFDFKRNTK